MLIREWVRDETEDIWIRTAVSYPGPIIVWGGQRESYPEFMSRRHVAIDARHGSIRKVVFSVSYHSGFDSWNAYEVHEKYKAGEVVHLLTVIHDGDLQSALQWPGIVQELS